MSAGVGKQPYIFTLISNLTWVVLPNRITSNLGGQHFEAPFRQLPEPLPVAVLDRQLVYLGVLLLGQSALSARNERTKRLYIQVAIDG